MADQSYGPSTDGTAAPPWYASAYNSLPAAAQDPGVMLGALGTLGGLGSGLYGASQQRQAFGQGRADLNLGVGSAQSPINFFGLQNPLQFPTPNPVSTPDYQTILQKYYQPMTDAESTAFSRSYDVSNQLRGIQDSNLAAMSKAEAMAGTETQRMQAAMPYASQEMQQTAGLQQWNEQMRMQALIQQIMGQNNNNQFMTGQQQQQNRSLEGLLGQRGQYMAQQPGFPAMGSMGALGGALQNYQMANAMRDSSAASRDMSQAYLAALNRVNGSPQQSGTVYNTQTDSGINANPGSQDYNSYGDGMDFGSAFEG